MIASLLAVALAAAPAAPSLSEAELAPALSGPPARAGALLEAGQPGEALSALGNASRPEARLVRALALEATGAAGPALAALEALEIRLPELADFVLAARGRLLLGSGRRVEAGAAFQAVATASPLAAAARVGRARALAAEGDRDGALALLAPLLEASAEAPEAATALLLAGQLQAGATPPRVEQARRALLDCWAGHPAEPEAVACRATLDGLPGGPPPAEEVVRRAEGLVERSRNGEAIALLEPVVRASPAPSAGEPLACRARAALGRALRRDRQNGRAAELLRPVAERCPDPALRTRALYVLATAVAASGGRDEASALYRRFAREHPDSPLADDALFAAAELALRDGRIDEARGLLGTLVREHPTGDMRDEARFRQAWLAWRGGDPEAALAAFLAIEEETRELDPYEHARAAYWRARLLSARGEAGRAAARAIWAELVAGGPADYYALLARGRLAGEAGVSLPAPEPAPASAARPLEPGPLASDPAFRAGLAFLRAGLPRHAAEALAAVDRSRLEGREAGPALCLAEVTALTGDHHASLQLVRGEARAALRRRPEGLDRRAWEVAYPPAHAELVRRHAPPAGVPAELLQALMREESALDPEAISPAGAVGLTQLMLPTARAWARKLSLPRPDRAALTVPATSIRIGAAYLGALLTQFDGSPVLALAAYNAGENAVARWRAAAPRAELDEFVEEIPYDETRGYVKRVLRSYAAYRLLSGAASAARDRPAAAPAGG